MCALVNHPSRGGVHEPRSWVRLCADVRAQGGVGLCEPHLADLFIAAVTLNRCHS